jgi:hypothetical protein
MSTLNKLLSEFAKKSDMDDITKRLEKCEKKVKKTKEKVKK